MNINYKIIIIYENDRIEHCSEDVAQIVQNIVIQLKMVLIFGTYVT